MKNSYRKSSASRSPATKEYTYELGESERSGPFIRTSQGSGRNGEFINTVAELDSFLARADAMRAERTTLAAHLTRDAESPEDVTVPTVDPAMIQNLARTLGIPPDALKMFNLIGTGNAEPPVKATAALPDEPEMVFLVGDVVQFDTRKWPYEVVTYDVKTDVATIKRLPWGTQRGGERATRIDKATERLSLWDA